MNVTWFSTLPPESSTNMWYKCLLWNVLWGQIKLLTQYYCGRLTFYVQYAVGTRLTIYFTDAGPQSAVCRLVQSTHTCFHSASSLSWIMGNTLLFCCTTLLVRWLDRTSCICKVLAVWQCVHQRLYILPEHCWARLLTYSLCVRCTVINSD